MRNGPRRAPYFSLPDVHTGSATAPNYMIFFMFWCSCNEQTSLQKNWSENTQWLVRFWVISLEKTSKRGAKMGQNQIPSKPEFQHPISISNILEVYWWCFGGKKTCGWVEMRAYVCCLCQNRPKTEAEHPPRPPGASISPQIPPEAYLYDKTQFASRKGACPDFRSVNPLCQFLCLFVCYKTRADTAMSLRQARQKS